MDGKLRNMASIYLQREGRTLLLYRIGSKVVAPSWCGVGGHFEKEELDDARAAALRELKEEIGLTERDLSDLACRYITLRLKGGEVRQNYYFFAHLNDGVQIPASCSEGILEWVDDDMLLQRDMPHTAKYVLEHYVRAGRHNRLLYCGTAQRDGVAFHILEEF